MKSCHFYSGVNVSKIVNFCNIKNSLIKQLYVINIGVGVYITRFMEIAYSYTEPANCA